MMLNKTQNDISYQLCKEKRTDIEIFSVKLTDSALRTLENASSKNATSIKLSVDGSRGTLSIPGKQSYVSYDLSISPYHQKLDGSLEVIQFSGSRAINLGNAVSKLTVQANAESFNTAKQRMAEAEDQRKSYSKANLLPNPKRSSVRDSSMNPRSVLTPPGSRNPDSKISPTSVLRSCSPQSGNAYKSPLSANAEVGSRSLRDRIIHLLAIHPYQRPELILRLKRDGLSEEQKERVDAMLRKVGRTGRQGEYHLNQAFINLVEPNWPGYSPSERSSAASLKAKYSTSPTSSGGNPTNRVTPSGGGTRQDSSPQVTAHPPFTTAPTSSSTLLMDDFGRKPTRASAPAAPHAMSKKIAALDLLVAGVSLENAASQHGIPTSLLENWKNNEASIRQKYAKLRGTTVLQATLAPLSSASSSQDISSSSAPAKNSNDSAATTVSKPSASKRARLSSTSGDNNNTVMTTASGPPTTAPITTNSTAFQSNRRAPAASAAAVPNPGASFKDPSPPGLGNKRASPGPARRKRPYEATTTTSSTVSVAPPPPPMLNGGGGGAGRPHDRGSETSSYGDSCSPPVDSNTPLSQTYTRGATMTDFKVDKGQRMFSCNEEKTSDTSDEDYLYDTITARNSEVERRYPTISSAKQAAEYREAFESLYPKYLHLYNHYREAWDKVIGLKERIVALVGGPHVDEMTRLATELDDFLNRMRKPECREEEVRLLVMTFKLQHLKQRLADYAASQDNAGGNGSGGATSSSKPPSGKPAAQQNAVSGGSGYLRTGAFD